MYYPLSAVIGLLAHLLYGLQCGWAGDPFVGIAGVASWVICSALLRSTLCHRYRGVTFAGGVVHALAWIHIHAFASTLIVLSRDHSLADASKSAFVAGICVCLVSMKSTFVTIPLAVFGAFVLRLLPNKTMQPTGAPSGAGG